MDNNKINHIKQLSTYRFYCDINPEEVKNYNYFDEWGRAYVEIGNIGAEYNLCLDNTGEALEDNSAIYKMSVDFSEGIYSAEWSTDYNEFIGYQIGFDNPNWMGCLEDALIQAMIDFFNL